MKRSPLLLALLALATSPLTAQKETPPAITLAEALKLGPDGIAEKRDDLSEVGMGAAAVFYATAKRLETENALAAKDLFLVVELDRYRKAIVEWDGAWSEAMYAASGGGTMWVHLSSHLEAAREDLLATLAKRMPLKAGNATSKTLAKWNVIGAAIESAPVPEYADEETKQNWPQQKKALHAIWERFSYEFQALDEPDALFILEHLLPDEEQLGMLKGE
jgi:hypothetical protein